MSLPNHVLKGLALLLVFFTWNCAQASDWKILETGLEYKKIDGPSGQSSTSESYRIHAFRIDPRKFHLRPLISKPQKTSSIRQMSSKAGAVIGINANFFDPEGNPLGLVIDKGKILNRFKQISWWSIFYTNNTQPHLIHSSQYNPRTRMTTAIQAGPRLLINGSIPKLKKEVSPKTAIGFNRKGQIILAATRNDIDITEFARIMARSGKKGGLGCYHALNLDGGSSSQLYAKVGSFKLNLPSYVEVPVGLGVFRR